MNLKTNILFLGLLLAGNMFSQKVIADSSNIQLARESIHDVTDSVIDACTGAVMKVIEMIHWSFMLILIFCASFFNEAVEAENWANYLSFLKKTPRGARTFFIGIFFLIITCWAYRVKDRIEIVNMLLTIFFSMGIMSIGINKVIRFLAERFGLRFGK